MHRIVVGSLNPTKLTAVSRATERVWPQATVVGVEAESGVAAMPLSDDEAIAGAIQRARHAMQQIPAGLAVGVESNVTEMSHGMFSTAWAAILNEDGTIGIGSSGRFLLPVGVAKAIRAGAELGPLMDRMVGGFNTKQKQGAIGILSAGLVDRSAALETAVMYALTRILAPQLYAE